MWPFERDFLEIVNTLPYIYYAFLPIEELWDVKSSDKVGWFVVFCPLYGKVATAMFRMCFVVTNVRSQ